MEAMQMSAEEQHERELEMSRKATAHGIMLPGLRLTRIYRDLTVVGLAEKAGVAPKTVTTLENGRRGAYPHTLDKLARALNVSPYTLYRDWDTMIEEYGEEEDETG